MAEFRCHKEVLPNGCSTIECKIHKGIGTEV